MPYRDQCLAAFGLSAAATAADFEQAYRDLINVWHPDRFGHNPRLKAKADQKLKEINAASFEPVSLEANIG